MSALLKERSQAAETVAGTALLRFTHEAFPLASLSQYSQRLLSSFCGLSRTFCVTDDVGFEAGRKAFLEATLLDAGAARPAARAGGAPAIDFSPTAAYGSPSFKELEVDCMVKIPVHGNDPQWTRDESSAAPGLFFLAKALEQALPPRAAPTPTSTLLRPPRRESTRFSDEFYPPSASAYVLAEVYAPLHGKGGFTRAQKLLQAERTLQFLKANQDADSVRECVLGFVFIGPDMTPAAGEELFLTLQHYHAKLPCLWELLRPPCRLLCYKIDLQWSAAESFRMSGDIADTKARVESLDARVESLDARVESLDARVGALDARVGALDARVGALDARIGALDTKVEALITALARDNAAQFALLREQIAQLAPRPPPQRAQSICPIQ